MKNYKVECMHNVYVDSFENGELEHVQFFDTKGEYKVEKPFDAIEKHLDSLGYDFKKENCEIDEEQTNKVWYSVLVDDENCKASDSEIELWKKDEIKLYSNNLTVYVYELVAINLENEL